MKTPKKYPLIIMLAVLMAHTVMLSFWLAGEESTTRKSNFKGETNKEGLIDVNFYKSNFTLKDSIRINHQQLMLSKSYKETLK